MKKSVISAIAALVLAFNAAGASAFDGPRWCPRPIESFSWSVTPDQYVKRTNMQIVSFGFDIKPVCYIDVTLRIHRWSDANGQVYLEDIEAARWPDVDRNPPLSSLEVAVPVGERYVAEVRTRSGKQLLSVIFIRANGTISSPFASSP